MRKRKDKRTPGNIKKTTKKTGGRGVSHHRKKRKGRRCRQWPRVPETAQENEQAALGPADKTAKKAGNHTAVGHDLGEELVT